MPQWNTLRNSMARLKWNNTRQGPGDFDDTAPTVLDYSFDHARSVVPGGQSWPDKFGPANIRKAWKAGLVVVAQVPGFPHPVALEGYRIADRIWTRPDARHLTSSGLLIESSD
jgi:hypothetical protein